MARRVENVTNTLLLKAPMHQKLDMENLMSLVTRENKCLVNPRNMFYLLYKLASSGSSSVENSNFHLPLDSINDLNVNTDYKQMVSLNKNYLYEREREREKNRDTDIRSGKDYVSQMNVNRNFFESIKGNIPGLSINEKEVVKDLINCLSNVRGKYIDYNEKNKEFMIKGSLEINVQTYLSIKSILELSYLFKEVADFLKTLKMRELSLNKKTFLSLQSYSSALQEEISQYYRFISILETTKDLDIQNLQLYCNEPIERLKVVNQINKNINNSYQQYPLASLIYRMKQNGNFHVKKICTSFLLKVNQPILDRIYTWMNEGRLNETTTEFFISKNDNCIKEESWNKMYQIFMDFIPLFISFDLAFKIFVTGKSIDFIKQECDHAVSNGIEPIDIGATIDPLTDRRLTNWVNSAYFSSTNKLLKVLYEQFHFPEHLRFIKDTMLLCKGDFAYSLIEQAEFELDKLHTQVFKHRLTSCLDLAIKNSNLSHIDHEYIDRLKVYLFPGQSGDRGWDMFSLDYHIPDSLMSILSLKNVKNLKLVFRQIWRIKRLSYFLNRSVRNTMRVEFGPLTSYACTCRSMMSNFINTIHNYFMLEAIENSFHDYFKQIGDIPDMDKLIEATDALTERMVEKFFIHEKYKRVNKFLEELYRKIEQFIAHLQQMEYGLQTYEVQVEVKRIYAQYAGTMVKMIEWLYKSNSDELKSLAVIFDFNHYFEYAGIDNQESYY